MLTVWAKQKNFFFEFIVSQPFPSVMELPNKTLATISPRSWNPLTKPCQPFCLGPGTPYKTLYQALNNFCGTFQVYKGLGWPTVNC